MAGTKNKILLITFSPDYGWPLMFLSETASAFLVYSLASWVRFYPLPN